MNPPWVYMCSPSWTPLSPPSPYHPSRSSQCSSPKHPVSCIKPGLVIHFIYDIIHVSMSFSQIIPPSPSPTESKDYSIHLCLFCCLTYRVIAIITEFHIVSNMLECLLNWPPLPFYVLKEIFGQRWKCQLLILSVRWLWWDILAHCSHSLVWKLKGRIFTCNNRNIE